MFSGVIEELGTVRSLSRQGKGYTLTIESSKLIAGSKQGDSISVNGVCLTITNADARTLSFDVLDKTLSRANLQQLRSGDRVNLERALMVGDRISGHFVTGHIDCQGRILSMTPHGGDLHMTIEVKDEIVPYLAPRCSIAVDGVSLTVGEIKHGSITIYLIPLTRRETTLGSRKAGDLVNLEADILAKYAMKNETPAAQPASSVTSEHLKKHGFA